MSNEIGKLLVEIAAELDISDSAYKHVVERYKSVGEWLGREESEVAEYDPVIYSQGSIALGTVVKPINDEDEYDIDLVCESLKLSKAFVTQSKLKKMVGNEIKKYAKAKNMNSGPDEGRRCWTLLYAESSKFHLDVLPAIPDGTAFTKSLEAIGKPNQWSSHAIAITDNQAENYTVLSSDWPQSNPKGYVMWFQSRMRRGLFEARKSWVEPVAEYKVKTPLQQAIQLLKRHRDIMFADDTDDKPISVIITTLAAYAYNGENTVSDALLRIINNMEDFIQNLNGIAWIANPTNPNENFADKWVEHPQRKTKFKKWANQVKDDFNRILTYQDSVDALTSLASLLGEHVVNRAAAKVFETKDETTFSKVNIIPVKSQILNVAHRQQPTWRPNILGRVKITCEQSKNGFRPKRVRSGIPISKHWALFFQAHTDISHPYKVYWQVVNTGDEARIAGQLRGGFYDGATYKGSRQWKESSLYKGTHWIECFIIKHNEIVARSGEFLVVIE